MFILMTTLRFFCLHLCLATRTLYVRTYLLFIFTNTTFPIELKIPIFLLRIFSVSSSASNNAKSAGTVDQSVESAKINESNNRLLRDIAHQAAALKAELEMSLLKGSYLCPYSIIQKFICKSIHSFVCLQVFRFMYLHTLSI